MSSHVILITLKLRHAWYGVNMQIAPTERGNEMTDERATYYQSCPTERLVLLASDARTNCANATGHRADEYATRLALINAELSARNNERNEGNQAMTNRPNTPQETSQLMPYETYGIHLPISTRWAHLDTVMPTQTMGPLPVWQGFNNATNDRNELAYNNNAGTSNNGGR